MEIGTTAAAKCSHFTADEIEALKERLLSMLFEVEYRASILYYYYCYCYCYFALNSRVHAEGNKGWGMECLR